MLVAGPSRTELIAATIKRGALPVASDHRCTEAVDAVRVRALRDHRPMWSVPGRSQVEVWTERGATWDVCAFADLCRRRRSRCSACRGDGTRGRRRCDRVASTRPYFGFVLSTVFDF